ncbi:MAG: DNA polymerase IV [Alphaproteobacteria bacterium]|nr:DNA polymerase IV [Alphaproteobacteria bacterium]
MTRTGPRKEDNGKITACLECATIADRPTGRCTACGSPRIVSHPELQSLAIAHVDCDAFYASVEKRDRPEIAAKPVIVGGRERGVVAAACYLARVRGVHSAMPIVQARRLCPEAVIVKPDMNKYTTVGREIRELMRSLTPLVEPLSIDEAFLDLTGTDRLHAMSPAAALIGLAGRIEREIGVTVSIGLSHNKFLAKLASDLDKPRGFSIIGRAETLDRLATMDVSRIWGVGKNLQSRLNADGITKIGQLREFSEIQLTARYGSMGLRLHRLASGRDERKVEPNSAVKSVSSETTFSMDITDRRELVRRIWLLSEEVSRRLKSKGLSGRTVHLKLRTPNFKTMTRSRTAPAPTQLAERIYEIVEPVVETCWREFGAASGIRLAGIGVSGLAPAEDADPPDIAEPGRRRAKQLEGAMDAVRAKHGSGAILKGRALPREGAGRAKGRHGPGKEREGHEREGHGQTRRFGDT